MYTKSDVLVKLNNDLTLRNYAGLTKDRYSYVCNNFLNYMERSMPDKKISDYDENDAIMYLNYLTTVRHNGDKTYNHVNSILKFLLEVTLEKDIAYKRMPSRKLPDKLKVIPSYNTIMNIINNTENKKHKIWFMLAYGSGLRPIEIVGLKVRNIYARDMKVIVEGKGKKEKMTTLSIETLNLLREYAIEESISGKETYLFPGKGRDYICQASVASALANIVKKLGIEEHVTPMALRRSFATHLLRSGEELQVVKELMGHKSILTTSGYISYMYKELEIKSPLDRDI